MIGRLMSKLWGRGDHTAGNGAAAHRADVEAAHRLDRVRSSWPEVNETRDLLAEWVQSALRLRGD